MNFSLDYKDCDFASLQNSLLRDMIIIDILDKRLQARLLGESDITLENTIKHCKASEVTKKHVKILQHQAAPASVAKISTKKVRTSKSHAKRAKKSSLCSASSLVIAIKEASVYPITMCARNVKRKGISLNVASGRTLIKLNRIPVKSQLSVKILTVAAV